MSTLHEDQYTFMITPHSVLLRMRNISGKSCREKTHFLFSNFFVANLAIYEVMWKNVIDWTGHR